MDPLQDSSNGGANGLADGAASRVASATAAVKQKHAGWGGRRVKGQAAAPGAPAPGVVKSQPRKEEQVEEVASEADLAFVEETAKSVLQVIDKLITAKVYGAVCSIVPGDAKLEERGNALAKQVHVENDEVELVGRTSKAIAAKYPGMTRWAPEMALAGWVASYGMRATTVLTEVRNLTAAVRAMQGQGNAKKVGEEGAPDAGQSSAS